MADLNTQYNIKTLDDLINGIQETQDYIQEELGEKISQVQYSITEIENLNQFNTEFNNIKSQLSNLEYQTSQIEELIDQLQTQANIRFFQSAGQNLFTFY